MPQQFTLSDGRTVAMTVDQENALHAFTAFLANPLETTFVLAGYSGTGKSSLVGAILDQLPNILKTLRLLDPNFPDYQPVLSATTNKAAEALSLLSGQQVRTVHSTLGLRVQKDFRTGNSFLVSKDKIKLSGLILFIDEASMVDSELLGLVYTRLENCKVVFMGDPAQIATVKSSKTPVFDTPYPGAKLTQVVRQAEGNPIIQLATQFRETVTTGVFTPFKPDGQAVIHLPKEAFVKELEKEFFRPNWRDRDSKILAWTNKTVVYYNEAITEHLKGAPDLQAGDYAVCNSFVSRNSRTIKTGQMVLINSVRADEQFGYKGAWYNTDAGEFFMPTSIDVRKAAIKRYREAGNDSVLFRIENEWIDLRAAYACTVDKAQGSTYDRVYIDLEDISKCTSGDRIARMMYVAVSRARHQVFLTGDFGA